MFDSSCVLYICKYTRMWAVHESHVRGAQSRYMGEASTPLWGLNYGRAARRVLSLSAPPARIIKGECKSI